MERLISLCSPSQFPSPEETTVNGLIQLPLKKMDLQKIYLIACVYYILIYQHVLDGTP